MRRELKYPIAGFGMGAIGGGIANLIIQFSELEDEGKSFWDNVNWDRVLKSAGRWGVAGAAGGYLYYQLKVAQESSLPFYADDYLHKVLMHYNVKGNKHIYNDAISKRESIKDFLKETFKGKLAGSPVNWGSTARGTAIGDNYDFDIIIPFKRNSYNSLEEMYTSVYNILYKQYAGYNVEVRKQKRSLGITFFLNETELHFDIVPGREVNDYKLDKNLNLFVRPDNFWSNPSRIKTNLDAHRNLTKNRPEERKVVKLVKLYRDLCHSNIHSTLLQNITVKAFENQEASSSLSNNFIHTLEYIAEKLPILKVVDPANTNNILTENVSSNEINNLVRRINNDLFKIENNDRYLKEIFQL